MIRRLVSLRWVRSHYYPRVKRAWVVKGDSGCTYETTQIRVAFRLIMRGEW